MLIHVLVREREAVEVFGHLFVKLLVFRDKLERLLVARQPLLLPLSQYSRKYSLFVPDVIRQLVVDSVGPVVEILGPRRVLNVMMETNVPPAAGQQLNSPCSPKKISHPCIAAPTHRQDRVESSTGREVPAPIS